MCGDSSCHQVGEYWLLITDFTSEIGVVYKLGFPSPQSSQSQKESENMLIMNSELMRGARSLI